MRHLLALLSGLLIAAPLVAVEKEGLRITLTAEEDADCAAGGGCIVIPRRVAEKLVVKFAREAFIAGQATCADRT